MCELSDDIKNNKKQNLNDDTLPYKSLTENENRKSKNIFNNYNYIPSLF